MALTAFGVSLMFGLSLNNERDDMEPTLEKTAIELLDWLKGAAETGGDFVQEQAPLLAQEIVAYERGLSTFHVIACVLITAMALVTLRMIKWKEIGNDNPEGIFSLVGVIVAALALVVVPLFGIYAAERCMKSWVAPRLVVIEKAAELLP